MLKRTISGLSLGVALCVTVGCGSDFSENVVGDPPEGYIPRAFEAIEGAEDYPVGVYGGDEGDIIRNMRFAGYFSDVPVEGIHTTDFQESVTFQQIRELEGYTHMLLSVGAEWCKPCAEEAVTLRNAYPDWSAKGGFILSVMTQDRQRNAADRTVIDAWSRRFTTNYTLVVDPEGYVANDLASVSLPLNVVIDLETMTILRSVAREDPDTFRFFESLLR